MSYSVIFVWTNHRAHNNLIRYHSRLRFLVKLCILAVSYARCGQLWKLFIIKN
jgi:hypothetical protein